MKILILLAALIGSTAFADSMYLHCFEGKTPDECGIAVETALNEMGCEIVVGANCTMAREEDPNDSTKTVLSDTAYCEVESSNCDQPRVGNFGGESCDAGVKVKIPKFTGVHNGYWFGFIGSYSRTLCKN